MIQNNQQTKYWIIQLCYFLFGALCICIPSGYSYGPSVLLLLSLPILINRKKYPVLDTHTQLILLALLSYVVIQAISIVWDGGTIKEFDRPSRALMTVSILLLCLRYPPRFLWMMNGIATGAIAAGLHAIWDRQITGYDRAFEWITPIQGGDISMSLGLFSLCGVMWAIKTMRYRYLCFFSVASIMGILGSLLSGSRGGWVLLPVTLFVGYRIFECWLSKRAKLILTATLCLLVVFCLIPQSGVTQRIEAAKQDISQYVSGETTNTSLGLRFEFWKSALDSFAKKPIFGWGNHSVRISQKQQYDAGFISKDAYDANTHAHNQFFDEMAKRGVIGLAAVLVLFLLPLFIFKQQLNQSSSDPEKTVIAACGIILILSTIDYCLSQAFLNHNSGIIFYSFSVCMLFSAQYANTQKISLASV
jgi:Lipid A core - O-antigen ligase and related enzymes